MWHYTLVRCGPGFPQAQLKHHAFICILHGCEESTIRIIESTAVYLYLWIQLPVVIMGCPPTKNTKLEVSEISNHKFQIIRW